MNNNLDRRDVATVIVKPHFESLVSDMNKNERSDTLSKDESGSSKQAKNQKIVMILDAFYTYDEKAFELKSGVFPSGKPCVSLVPRAESRYHSK